MSPQLRALRMVRVLVAIIAAAAFGAEATEPAVGVTAVARESFEIENFTCTDAMSQLPTTMESPVILQLFNEPYLRMQQNFLMFIRQNAPQRMGSLYLVCFDEASAAAMDDVFGLPCLWIEGVTTRALLLSTRVNMIRCLLEGGHDVLMSDNDALWLADPIPNLRTLEGDMLFQRGIFPERFQEPVYGQTLCAGFAMYRAGSEGIAVFMEKLVEQLGTVKSDQVAHNMVVSGLQLEWNYNESVSDMNIYESTRVGLGVLKAAPGNFVVGLLPHKLYTRNCIETPISPETLVVHCVPRTNREAAMRKENMWLLD